MMEETTGWIALIVTFLDSVVMVSVDRCRTLYLKHELLLLG